MIPPTEEDGDLYTCKRFIVKNLQETISLLDTDSRM